MSLSNNDKKLFIHSSLLKNECRYENLRNILQHNDIPTHSFIRFLPNEGIVVVEATHSQQNLSDLAFQLFVEQKITDGYIYASLKSFKLLLGLD